MTERDDYGPFGAANYGRNGLNGCAAAGVFPGGMNQFRFNAGSGFHQGRWEENFDGTAGGRGRQRYGNGCGNFWHGRGGYQGYRGRGNVYSHRPTSMIPPAANQPVIRPIIRPTGPVVQQEPIVIAPAVDQVQPTAQPTVGVAQPRVVNLVRQ